MVKAYLADSKVMIKNKHHVTFDVSIRVFVYRMQTPVIPMPASPCDSNGGDVLNFSEIKGRFEKAHVAPKQMSTKPPLHNFPSPPLTFATV